MSNCTFIQNSADEGGAIKYTKILPVLLNCNFVSNSAPYGSDIASYPVALKFGGTKDISLTLIDVDSGQTSPEKI